MFAMNIYARCAAHWPVCRWNDNKTEEIDFTRNWVWIDDDPSPVDEANIKKFAKPGVLGQLILSDPYSCFELDVIQEKLEKILKQHKEKTK